MLEQEPAEVKNQECDALISAAEDPSLRRTIALKIYDHYRNSKLMGDETVAIHLIDTWFASGKVGMRDDSELFEAKMFAEFNRQSLIGCKAPVVMLASQYGGTVPVPVPEGYSVLYFYDTDCAKCKFETPVLCSLLDDKEYPVTFYAIYVGTNEDRWKQWRDSAFKIETDETEVVHLWDPDNSADLQFAYGVVQTPKMFVVDPEGTIVGRELDTDSLEQLLDILLDDGEYHYGSEASRDLFEKIFATYGGRVASADVSDVAAMLKGRTLDLGDTLNFKHLEGDLLYFLATKRDEGYREGTADFVDSYILSRPDIWNTEDDSLMVVGMAEMLDGLLSKTPVGSVIPRMGIKGWNRFRKEGGYLFFHAEGCPICEEEMRVADSLGVKYFAVNMDALESKSRRKTGKLLDTFDLSALPLVLEIDKGGIVKRRYTSLVDRLLFLDEKE
ncbi:MAG: redoxin domain-containing protein [Bacteroidales bacterium]|nr:redoxin domain-containing protein [Bacteroidales bacterium]